MSVEITAAEATVQAATTGAMPVGFTFQTTPNLIVQPGAAGRLHTWCGSMGLRRVMLVTDAGLRATGVLEPLLERGRAAGLRLTVWDGVQADPPQHTISAAVDAAVRAEADGIVGLGGGSAMDTAKLVALLARTPQPLDDIFGVDLARGPRLPLIQIPTTAGTGSEVTPIAIVTTPTDEKKGVVSPVLYPDLALLDATLTVALPPAVTAMTGIDAMVHAIEAYTSRIRKNPISDALAIKALALLHAHLRRVLMDGHDLEARGQMLLGAAMAGMAFANAPVGGVHALAYPLGGRFHVPHGHSNALMLGPVLQFNLPAAEAAYAELGRVVGSAHAGASVAEAARAFVIDMGRLVADMPLAHRLTDLGIRPADIPVLADDAMKVTRLLVNNPRELGRADALGLYTAVL